MGLSEYFPSYFQQKELQPGSSAATLTEGQSQEQSCPKTGFWIKTSQLKSLEAEESLLEGLQYVREQVPIDVGRSHHYINTVRFPSTDKLSNKHIVLTHGYGAGLGFFFKNFKALQSTGASVHTLDWLGMANSSRPPLPTIGRKRRSIDYLTDEDAPEYLDAHDVHAVKATEAFFVDSLEQWRHKSDIEKMTLVGHSLGGYLSTAYALKYPERVEKLVLVSPVGVPEPPPHIVAPHQHQAPQKPSWLIQVARKLWTWNITPQGIIRTVGPYGPRLVNAYTSRRFAHLDTIEQEKLKNYLYHISAQSGSGEYALSRLLMPGKNNSPRCFC
jgi:pimeloyl-ACP methyl ester carboxylesterase